MTQTYSAQVTDYFDTQNDELAIEIIAPANETVKIKKIRIMYGNGIETATSDSYRRAKLVLESAAGTGGASYTPIKTDPNSVASSSTVKIGTGSFTPGTISTTIDTLSIHTATDFYWAAADEDDKIVLDPSNTFGIIIASGG